MDFPEIAMRRPQGDPCNPVRSSLFHPLPGEEGNKMRKIMFLGLLVVFLPAMVSAQEKIDAPAWNVGDKWTFTGDGIIEVIKADQSGYTLKFSKRTCIYETQGYDTILFHKSSLNRLNFLEGDKQKKYTRGHKKLFDFPLSVGKQWKDAYSTKPFFGTYSGQNYEDYSEKYSVLGWEGAEVRAGKFKALKVEYRRMLTGSTSLYAAPSTVEIKSYYWYSPEAKYFVKCQYDKEWMEAYKEFFNWEVTSFQLKK